MVGKLPEFLASSFYCPLCHVFAAQTWDHRAGLDARKLPGISQTIPLELRPPSPLPGLYIAHCAHCGKFSIWMETSLIYPSSSPAPLPTPDMPEDVRLDYEEARQIAAISPRGAAALLRLALEKLFIHLGEHDKNINNSIKNLVTKGLDPQIQKMLDIVRVVGNHAVHPGTLDLRDNMATVKTLFELLNLIVDDRISRPRKIDEIYGSLPDDARSGIDKRDGNV